MKSKVKLMAKAPKPRMVCINSANVFGTSSDTTSKVIANPKTASLRPSVRDTSRLRQRNFRSSPTRLSISFSRIIGLSLRRRFYGGLDNCVEFHSGALIVANKAFDQVTLAIEDKRLWNIVVVAEIPGDQIVVGIREQVLNTKFPGEARNFFPIIIATDIQTDNLK